MSAEFTLSEVAKHNQREDCWVVVNNEVYDMTKFLNEHPGGASAIMKRAGTDASVKFNSVALHQDPDVFDRLKEFRVGSLID
ncbi:MAG: cytochrome b5-like heme/steroid binding domain-containing protein [Sulfobacillus sp.]